MGVGFRPKSTQPIYATHEETRALADHLRNLNNISLLINNAGFGIEASIAEAAVDGQLAMMHVHMTAPYLLCQAVLPQMIERLSGAIINVSSIAAYFHGANAANYCATKAYLNSFSQSLQLEVAQHGIKVQALCPGYTVTEFHDAMGEFDRGSVPDRLWDSAEFVVTSSLNALSGDQVIVIPGRKNRMLVASSRSKLVRPMRKLAGRIIKIWR